MRVVGASKLPRDRKNMLSEGRRRPVGSISRLVQRTDHETGVEGEQQRCVRELVSWNAEEGMRREHCGCAVNRKGLCTSTRAVGCSLRGSAQILQLKVKRCGPLQCDRIILLSYGEDVEGEAARERAQMESHGGHKS